MKEVFSIRLGEEDEKLVRMTSQYFDMTMTEVITTGAREYCRLLWSAVATEDEDIMKGN